MFGTTSLFLERLGLDRLADLPPLGDFVPGADVVEVLEHGLRPAQDTGRPASADVDEALPLDVEADPSGPWRDGHGEGADEGL